MNTFFWHQFWFTCVTYDAWFYWTHRFWHTCFTKIHAVHHEVGRIVPYRWKAVHHIDALEQMSIMVYVWLVMEYQMKGGDRSQIPWGLIAGFGCIGLMGLYHHASETTSIPGGIIMDASKHYVHHRRQNRNYGFYFTIWDRVCDTYQSTVNVSPIDATKLPVDVPRWHTYLSSACWVAVTLLIIY